MMYGVPYLGLNTFSNVTEDVCSSSFSSAISSALAHCLLFATLAVNNLQTTLTEKGGSPTFIYVLVTFSSTSLQMSSIDSKKAETSASITAFRRLSHSSMYSCRRFLVSLSMKPATDLLSPHPSGRSLVLKNTYSTRPDGATEDEVSGYFLKYRKISPSVYKLSQLVKVRFRTKHLFRQQKPLPFISLIG